MDIIEMNEAARRIIEKYFIRALILAAVIMPVIVLVLPDLLRH